MKKPLYNTSKVNSIALNRIIVVPAYLKSCIPYFQLFMVKCGLKMINRKFQKQTHCKFKIVM